MSDLPRWLALAASPTFAAMALWTGFVESDRADMICSVGGAGSPVSGMVLMYLLMAAFHSAPWLKFRIR